MKVLKLLLVALAAHLALVPVSHGSKVPAPLRKVHRIVFLGDSITQGGDYVTDVECWLLSQGISLSVLNLGLGSETATDLTDAENEGHLKAHHFGRPFISERLDRVLAATKPDMVIACYGMNDGASLPADETGLKRFSDSVTRLREAAMKAGARRVVICTPPVYDSGDKTKPGVHDENLSRYSAWIMAQKAKHWDVVDIHGPMRKELDAGREANPGFRFAGDRVHPGREGHWLMAREILTQFLGAKLDGITSAEQLFASNGSEIRRLLGERRSLLSSAWLTKTKHKRPGVPGGPGAAPGPSIEEANAKAAVISEKIAAIRGSSTPADVKSRK